MRMNELAARILGWANDRNLIEGSTVEKQFVKLVEEHGEFAAGLARGKLDVQADALGDEMVILLIMAAQAEYNLLENLADYTGAKLDYDDVVQNIKDNISSSMLGLIGVSAAFQMQTRNIGQLSYSIRQEDESGVEEGITLAFGASIALCVELGLEPSVVLEDVWNIIKDRKGKMVDGVFIKENDAMMAGGSNEQV